MSTTPVHGDVEKSAGLSFADLHHHPGNHSHMHHARERLQHFIHPNGKKIHVVDSPQAEVNLRRRLEQARQQQARGEARGESSDEDSEDFDIFISGTPEHLDALRAAHLHHSDRQEQLRNEHAEMYARFADVHYELDALSHELDRVTTHGVSLEAHFSKFGYDAHIKTYDDEEHTPGGSGTTTPRSTSTGGSSEGLAEKGLGKPLKFFQVPIVRQYFHKGTLWRSAGSEEVRSFELFVDLLYVGIIAVNGDATSEDPTAQSLIKFILTFTLSWKIWNDMTLIVSWFETDDLVQRGSILALIAMLFGYTTNIRHAFDGTYATLIGFYLAARLLMVVYLALVSYLVPMVRNVLLWHIAVALISSALWIGSIHIPWPWRYIPVWIAPTIDLSGPILFIIVRGSAEAFGPTVHKWFEEKFQFWPAINIEHRTERVNAFVSLVFGYSVVSMLYQTRANGINAHYGKAVLGIIQAFAFNWMYFEIDGSNLHLHAIRRHKYSSFVWTFSHLPFVMAFVLGSGALSKLVLAVDTAASDLSDLTEPYRLIAEKEIPQGIRWFYCAGYAISLAFMGFISISHVHRDSDTIRLRKKWRLCGRFMVCIIITCLPLAHSLNSLQLVSIVTGLVVYALFLELWCASCTKEKLFRRTGVCKYTGKCRKKELEALVKQGKELDLSQLGDRRDHSGCVSAL